MKKDRTLDMLEEEEEEAFLRKKTTKEEEVSSKHHLLLLHDTNLKLDMSGCDYGWNQKRFHP